MIGKLQAESKGHISGKYSFVNRTIQLQYQPPADALRTLSCKLWELSILGNGYVVK
jgi:hypothetical protein